MKNIMYIITVFSIFFCSCKSNDNSIESGNDGKEVSKTQVQIGDQIWMTTNLNVDTFRNGDPIPEAKTWEEWKYAHSEAKPAWCYYENDPANGNTYGKLYNWHAVMDPRGLAPQGWAIPSHSDWTTLINFLGGGKQAGKKLKASESWLEDGNGTNESGFLALPGGKLDIDNKYSWLYSWQYLGENSYYWSSTDNHSGIGVFNHAYTITLFNYADYVQISVESPYLGLSVRCIESKN